MGANEERVKRKAADLGFTHAGIARAEVHGNEAGFLQEWLSRGFQAGMRWMEAGQEKRGNPALVLQGVQSIVSVAINYFVPVRHSDDSGTGKISRYAWGDDYHDVVGDRLKSLAAWIEHEFPGVRTKAYVDTGPVMEKVWAQRAGIGWMGKHTNLITPDMGSWVFLGEVLTTLDLRPDEPATDHCGTCTLCIEACPTDAIVEPYVVDSKRCLSYLTIEHRGEFTEELPFENWIYGCDICQDVCPWNKKFAADSPEERFRPRGHAIAPPIREWEHLTAEQFRSLFKGSAMKRTRHEGLVRNVRMVRKQQENATDDPMESFDHLTE